MDITYQFMLPPLEFIAKATGSYGWAIVLLTVLIRILVYPLVASSTRSMQRMAQMQPQLKAIQNRYKNDPEMFQKKAMEFYQKNKINPMGGCLPTLVQLPVLFALFATFSGPPFDEKAIPVKVKVVPAAEAAQAHRAEISGANSPYVWPDGKLAKVVVYPGDTTLVAGSSLDFGTRAVDGSLPEDFKPVWKITGDAHKATIDEAGHATFPDTGEVTVNAFVPAVAKNESFAFMNSLGKKVQGLDLLKPENWDNLALILLFGATMWLSQKLMVQPSTMDPDSEQAQIQQQTQRIMPITVTAMFFFLPLPSGVFIYMVVSNVIQSLQTWFIMRKPAAALVDVLADGQAGKTIQVEAVSKNGDESKSNGEGKKISGSRKSRKKK